MLSVPHGGWTIPAAVSQRIRLDFSDIFPDSDPYTQQIYDLRDEVLYFHQADIARAIIDLNRQNDDLPPINPDGVVKTQTVTGKKIYATGMQLRPEEIFRLLRQHYYPYHLKIAADTSDKTLLCCFDCHSMLEYPPPTESGARMARPFICLSNNGDENGEENNAPLTAPPEMLRLLADCLQGQFPEEADEIVLNTPFKGGFISHYHSRNIPWIQIELNRRAYLKRPWFDPETMHIDGYHLRQLRDKFLQAFTSFCDQAAGMEQFTKQCGRSDLPQKMLPSN